MILHSIISPCDIFCNRDEPPGKPVYRRVSGGVIELDGDSRVKRLISTDPKMYLDRRYQPYSAFGKR